MKITEVNLQEMMPLFKSLIKSAILIPIIGSGFSCDCRASKGYVPNGPQMKSEMIKRILETEDEEKESLEQYSFQQIARYYNNFVSKEVRKKYLLDCFTKVKLSPLLCSFLNLPWKYLYTLNIDDAIEGNSDFYVLEPHRRLDTRVKEDGRVVFKIHGDAKNMALLDDDESFSVFDTDQYIVSLEKNKSILDQLKQDYIDKNLLFIGCSLQNELDLLHVFSKIYDNEKYCKTDRFYVSDKKLSKFQLLDLEKYGITKVVYVDSYDNFYESLSLLDEELKYKSEDELVQFKNIPIEVLDFISENNKDYILNGKNPFDKKKGKIVLLYYFIKREIGNKILEQIDYYPLQIVYGKRISGKTYLLLDILRGIADRDRYYFNSRERIGKNNIDYLLSKNNAAVIIDTHVLNEDDLNYIIKYDLKTLMQKNIRIILVSDVSKKSDALALSNANQNPLIKIYYLENKFREGEEIESLKEKMSSCNLLYFSATKTLLDNLILIQEKIGKSNQVLFRNFRVEPKNYLHIVYLLLLANYGKVTSADLIKFCLRSEPYELMPKLESAVEEDYRYMITASIYDNSYYQIVCNAQSWLLGYLSKIALNPNYFESIVKAFYYIVLKLFDEKNDPQKNKKLFKLIKFDNINMLLGGVRKRGTSAVIRKLIQDIYAELKPILSNEYQFNHQQAKCLLWAIEELNYEDRKKDIDFAFRSISLCLQQIQDLLDKKPTNSYLGISFAYAQFTLGIIRIKMFYFEKNLENYQKAVKQLAKALSYSDNMNARELFDDSTDDEKDYSVSKFMDSLVSGEWKEFNSNVEREVKIIVDCRIQKLIFQ